MFILHDKNVKCWTLGLVCVRALIQISHPNHSFPVSIRRSQSKPYISSLRSCGLEIEAEPMQGTSDKEATLKFCFSTVCFKKIKLSCYERASPEHDSAMCIPVILSSMSF